MYLQRRFWQTSLKNIQRPVITAGTTKLLFKYYHDHGPDKESDCVEYCLPECPEVNPEPNECLTLTEKCSRYNKYSFHDLMIQAVTHIDTQPSNKEYFEPKGSLDKEIKMENKTK